MKRLSLLVNSSDGFADAWQPFFELFVRYGGDLQACDIHLNTERATHQFGALRILPTRCWPADEPTRPTWSQCLIRGLSQVRTPYVLYMQEDYFLTEPVRTDVIQRAMDLLDRSADLSCVYLNRHGPQFIRCESLDSEFVTIGRPASYLLSTQAAVWRVPHLSELAAPWENGWMFEKFGSLRAARGGAYASVEPAVMRQSPVIDYVYTGILKGQWNRECIEVFRRHGIDVDFDRRGFYVDRGRLKSRLEVLRKLVEKPSGTLRSLRSVL